MFLARIISWSPTIKPWQIQLTHSPLEILPKNVFEATIGDKITWDTLP